ncbi:MAG: hypothetical protein KC931_20955 [Candidatus Omnitrophica bacterium]|nr:hypothetical protein [Candidatus Omnitrophota bacterium]MCA9425963.1 hypothetical protein [Candidatus Omnitrophota bacterium]MCA9433637.1 hypothetical protein [Candidatus Omnitrophota bacterium]MCA9444103.1 hypothetical protein [Candidatus Omnitrophota bacterium]MCA9449603.1 hypothetical protein [Candidatus Omnitrophota bacterium]
MDVNTVYQVSHLDAWEGSLGTGAGYLNVPRKKKEEDEEKENSRRRRKEKGITQDDSGIVHVDLIA